MASIFPAINFRAIIGGSALLMAFFAVQASTALALDKSSLLDKSLKALQLPGSEAASQEVVAEPIVFIYDDAIRLKWQKNLGEGSFVGIEGTYDYGSPPAVASDFDGENRVTFNVKAALGVALTEKSRVYFFTGASNAGLHISDMHYERDADFYLGIGFEINLTDELKLRAEYNLSQYGNNWVRDGFTEINRGQGEDQTFLTRMLWPF